MKTEWSATIGCEIQVWRPHLKYGTLFWKRFSKLILLRYVFGAANYAVKLVRLGIFY